MHFVVYVTQNLVSSWWIQRSEAKYCPVCGAVIDDVDTLNIDEDFMEEGWED